MVAVEFNTSHITLHGNSVEIADLSIHSTELVDYLENFPLDDISGLWSLDTPLGLGTLAVEIGRQSTLVGYNNAFVMYAMASLIALPLMLFIRIRPR